MPNLVFSSLSDPTIAHCINQNELVPFELLPKHQNTFSLIWVWWDKDLANVSLKDMLMEKVRVEEFGESKDEDCGWVNLVFLGFLSQNSLLKLSTFYGYKGIYSRVYEEYEESITTKQGILATRVRD